MFYVKVTDVYGEKPNFYISFNVTDRDGSRQKRDLFAPELSAFDFESFRRGTSSFYVAFKSLADTRSGSDYYRIYDVPANDTRRSHYLYMGAERVQHIGIDRFETPSLRAMLDDNCGRSAEIALRDDRLQSLYPDLKKASELSRGSRGGYGSAVDAAARAPREESERRSWREKEESRGVAAMGYGEGAAASFAAPESTFLSKETVDEMRFAAAVRRQKAEAKSWEAKEAARMAAVRSNPFAAFME